MLLTMNANVSRLSHYFCNPLVQDLVLITSTIGGSKLVTKNRSVLGKSPLPSPGRRARHEQVPSLTHQDRARRIVPLDLVKVGALSACLVHVVALDRAEFA